MKQYTNQLQREKMFDGGNSPSADKQELTKEALAVIENLDRIAYNLSKKRMPASAREIELVIMQIRTIGLHTTEELNTARREGAHIPTDDEVRRMANEYAERVCSGNFPITYGREQVVKHTANDFIQGANMVICNRFPGIENLKSSIDSARIEGAIIGLKVGLCDHAGYIVKGEIHKRIEAKLLTSLPFLPERCKDEWVKVSERLPESDDLDSGGAVWAWHKILKRECRVNWSYVSNGKFSHWRKSLNPPL